VNTPEQDEEDRREERTLRHCLWALLTALGAFWAAVAWVVFK
jgi:hypothetical protein